MIFENSRVLRNNVAYLTFVLIKIDGCFRGRWTTVWDGGKYRKVIVMHTPVVTEVISERSVKKDLHSKKRQRRKPAITNEEKEYRRRSK